MKKGGTWAPHQGQTRHNGNLATHTPPHPLQAGPARERLWEPGDCGELLTLSPPHTSVHRRGRAPGS